MNPFIGAPITGFYMNVVYCTILILLTIVLIIAPDGCYVCLLLRTLFICFYDVIGKPDASHLLYSALFAVFLVDS